MKHHVITNQVDLILFEEGSFVPANWLLREGRLDYDDYQNWKNGGLGYLEDSFNASIMDIVADLELVRAYATSLKLESFAYDYSLSSGRSLDFCRSPAHEDLLTTFYQPARNRVQMDLFMDSAPACVSNELANAIIAHKEQDLARLLSRLEELDPDKHRQFEHLLRLRKQLISDRGTVADKIKLLSDVMIPRAFTLFGPNTQDFIIPFWQRFTEQLEQQSFDVEKPNIHASYTAFKGYQWPKVLASVKCESEWIEQPRLVFRYAEACFKLNREQEGFENWFRLFFMFPETAIELIGRTSHALLLSDWRSFRELDQTLTADLFPAWVLLKKPALATMSKLFERQGLVNEAFQRVAELLNERSGSINRSSIDHRVRLRQEYPDLFGYYMETIANR